MKRPDGKGKCFLCKKRKVVYATKVRGRTLLLCEEHNKEYYGC